MNVCVSREECRVSLERVDARMEVDQGSELDHKSVSDKLRREPQRGDEEMEPPGLVCSSGGRMTRSRSSSVSSVSSLGAGSASTALAAARKSRRSDGFNANRRAATAANSGRGDGGSTVVVVSDDTKDGEEFFSPSTSREPSLKRKITDGEEVPEVTQRKQGRPQTTGLYVGRAKAQEEFNRELRETAELERENTLRKMSAGQLFANVNRNVEAYVGEMENAPMADVAHRIREHMAEVLRVASSSKNLQGGFIKILKQAAACGMAAVDVLRTRADSGESGNTLWQPEAMRREMENIKREARTAREESGARARSWPRLRPNLKGVAGTDG